MDQEQLQSFIQTPLFQLVAPAVTGLIGFLIGNRLSLDRDRRNEYNSIADQVRARLINMRGAVVPTIYEIPDTDWDLLLRRSSPIQAARLRKAMEQAKAAEDNGCKQDQLGQPLLVDPPAMRAARERIIELIPHR